MRRVGFAGTPEFAAVHLERLLESSRHGEFECVVVLTQPDRPAGRGQGLKPSPVKRLAQARGIPVLTPLGLRDGHLGSAEARQTLIGLHLDCLFVVAYGQLLPEDFLSIPRFGCINVHASLLPRWRGAAPIQRALEAGDTATGVCIMQMEQGLDTGPVWRRVEIQISPQDNYLSLHDRLAQTGAAHLAQFVSEWPFESGQPIEQSAEGVTYAHKLQGSDRAICFDRTAQVVANHIRCLDPTPGAVVSYRDQPIKLFGALLQETQRTWGAPGRILRLPHSSDDRLWIACREGAISIQALQKSGGKKMSVSEFMKGQVIKLDEEFQPLGTSAPRGNPIGR